MLWQFAIIPIGCRRPKEFTRECVMHEKARAPTLHVHVHVLYVQKGMHSRGVAGYMTITAPRTPVPRKTSSTLAYSLTVAKAFRDSCSASHALLRVCDAVARHHGGKRLGCVWGCDSAILWLVVLVQGELQFCAW